MLYLHIPFCQSRCLYCDFFSTTDGGLRGRYVDALCREIALRRDYLAKSSLDTIYLGGGTPSQLTPRQLHQLFDAIARVFDIDQCREVTLEANPDDLSPTFIAELRTLPVNRISMGVQTFDDDRLRWLRRRHTAAQAIEAVGRAQDAGYTNISVDLIYGFPHQTLAAWERDLQQAIALDVPHLSAYHLTYEEGTPLWNLYQKGLAPQVDEEVSVALFDMLIDTLTAAGYTHYEISNFCRRDRASRHNSGYWNDTPYLGCGAAAHSYNGTTRQSNVANLMQYIIGIENGTPDCEIEPLTLDTRYNDLITTALRTARGINLTALRHTYGETLYRHCLNSAKQPLAENLLTIEANHLHLTRKGIIVADAVMRELVVV